MGALVEAFEGTQCEDCGVLLQEGDPLYLTDDGKLCEECAMQCDYVCDCGSFKKQEFEHCWDCHTGGAA